MAREDIVDLRACGHGRPHFAPESFGDNGAIPVRSPTPEPNSEFYFSIFHELSSPLAKRK
jgi:hypothetical protein